MSKFLPPRATTALRLANTPLKGELLFDTDLDKLFIGDGVTVGGIEVGTGTGGGGDMLKSVYDTDNDGIVNEADVASLADLATAIAGSPNPLNYYGTNDLGAKGFFALQTTGLTVNDVSAVAITGNYSDLLSKPTLGTASTKDSGTLAGQVLLLTQNNKLPTLDGSLLTNLPNGGVISEVSTSAIISYIVAGTIGD